MEQRELLDIINIIRDKADNGKLVIFVGAGVSMNVEGMPSWYELIKEMAMAVGYSRCDCCKHKKPDCEASCLERYDYDPDEYLRIPQLLFERDNGKYYKILEAKLRAPIVDAPFSKVIFDLKPKHIVTTNYDHLLEQSTHPKRDMYKVIVEDKDIFKHEKNNLIIKLHGDIDNLKTIVLKEQDYNDFSNNHSLTELYFKTILIDYTILFIGYSLNDVNIIKIIAWLNDIRKKYEISFDSPIGYAVFDEESVSIEKKVKTDDMNISFVNVYNMPLVDNIPAEITADCGKRLFSFLKVIANPTLTRIFSLKDYLNNLALRLKAVDFLSYDQLAKMLDLKNVTKTGNILSLYTENDFNRVNEICECGYPGAEKIRQLFINSGISIIEYWNHSNPAEGIKKYMVGGFIDSDLAKEPFYTYYLSNDYLKLLEISKDDDNLFRKAFCLHLIQFYNDGVYEAYKQLGFIELDDLKTLNFQYNKAMLEFTSRFVYSLSNVKDTLQSITSEERKRVLSLYTEIVDGLNGKTLYINKELRKLKNLYQDNMVVIGGSLSSLYNIKNIAIEIYSFYFYNYLFIEKRGDIKNILSLYIEAILCTSGEREDRKDSFWGNSSKEKYNLDIRDWDIITKFISVKDLQNLISSYKVKRIELRVENKGLIEIFIKLISSVDCVLPTSQLSFWNTLANYFVLFNLVSFSDDELAQIEEVVCTLLSNKKFISFFFTVNYPDFRLCLQPLVSLCEKVIRHNQIEIVKEIIALNTFYDYFINSNRTAVKKLIDALMIGKENEEVQSDLIGIIDKETNEIYKNRLIWLFSNSITNEESVKALRCVINSNWQKLRSNMFLDFVFADWIELDKEKVEAIIHEVVELDNKRSSTGVYYMPDPLGEKIQELCILIITDKIDNLDCLLPIKNKTPQLEFLLAPDDFDYDRVDVSDYMWGNIMRSKKYLPYFIKAKEKMVPKIQRRITIGSASEFERKMLYGFLLDKEELF